MLSVLVVVVEKGYHGPVIWFPTLFYYLGMVNSYVSQVLSVQTILFHVPLFFFFFSQDSELAGKEVLRTHY